jgi:hypothetical protein
MTRNFFRHSTLQLLVAMAVVAVFVAANGVEVKKPAITLSFPSGGFEEVEYRTGWPFTFRRRKVFTVEGTGELSREDEMSLMRSTLKRNRIHGSSMSYMGNLLVGAALVFISFRLVDKLERNTASRRRQAP